MTTVTPNPHSPYATANPEYRHIFAVPVFFPAPEPGGLLPTACEAMAVVSEEVIETRPGAELPDGLCSLCVAVMNGGEPPARPSSECGACGSATWHGELCALCRQEKHEAWWPTRDQQSAAVEQPPAVWVEGDPLMEAIAAAVWERCGRSDSGSCVEDDPRTIAAVAAAVSVPPPAPRADAWLDAAAYLETLDPAEAALSGQYAWHNAAAHLRRKAGEDLFTATPCSPIVACEPGGEPCDTHERLLGHIEGDHELCGPECSGPCVAGEQQNETPETEAAAYRLAVTAIEAMPGYPRLVLPEEIVAELRRLADEEPTTTPATEAAVTMHAVPLPGSNGISACCGRPPCEFVGERITRDPDKVTCTGAAAGVRQDDTWTVKESTRRYAEELRATPGQASADGHTGWACGAGASLLAGADTPGPGRLGTHHGVIYVCAEHQGAAEERIAGAGYEPQVDPAPPGHRWNPWPCGHVTAYDTDALAALTGVRQDGAQS